MPWNGSAPNKTFGRTDGTRTGSQTWQEADAAGVDIVSDDHDTHDQDIADGLNQALLKDGGNTATANIPMGGFRFTNLGDATALTQAATGKQVLNSSFQYCSVGGTANTITLSTGFSATAYTAGMTVSWVVGSTNTGATTINVDSLGAKSLVRANGAHTALQPGDLSAGALVEAQYDGTRFQLRSPSASATSADVLARIVKAGSIVAWPHSTVPAGWLECYGQAVSRTTYAELYAAIGTTYGVGDGSTTFNLPDLRGRSIFGEDDMGGTSADRITSAVAGFDGDTLGATGGAQSYKLLRTDLPNVQLSGTTNITGAHDHDYIRYSGNTHNAANGGVSVARPGGTDETSTNGDHSHIVITESMNGGVTQTEFSKMPPAMVLKWIILANPAQASASTLGVHGLQYSWSTSTSGDPGAGHLLVDNSTLASATALNISETDGLAVSVADFLATWDDSTSTINGFIHVSKVGAPGTFAIFSTSGSMTDNGSYDTFTVAHIASAGTFANGDSVSVLFYRTGNDGLSGSDGGIRWAFDDSTTTNADPGAGNLRLNDASLPNVTEIAISYASGESGNPSVENFVKAWDDSTSTIRGYLIIKSVSAAENFSIYSIVSSITDGTTYGRFTISHVSSSGTFAASDILSIQFYRNGDHGDSGVDLGQVTVPGSTTIGNLVSWGTADGSELADSGVPSQFTQAGTGAVERTWLDKMRECLTPFDFDAVGDGVADDTTPLSRAIVASVAQGKTLWIPANCVLAITSVAETVAGNLTVRCDGTIKNRLGTSATDLMLTLTGDGTNRLIWKGGTFDGASSPYGLLWVHSWLHCDVMVDRVTGLLGTASSPSTMSGLRMSSYGAGSRIGWVMADDMDQGGATAQGSVPRVCSVDNTTESKGIILAGACDTVHGVIVVGNLDGGEVDVYCRGTWRNCADNGIYNVGDAETVNVYDLSVDDIDELAVNSGTGTINLYRPIARNANNAIGLDDGNTIQVFQGDLHFTPGVAPFRTRNDNTASTAFRIYDTNISCRPATRVCDFGSFGTLEEFIDKGNRWFIGYDSAVHSTPVLFTMAPGARCLVESDSDWILYDVNGDVPNSTTFFINMPTVTELSFWDSRHINKTGNNTVALRLNGARQQLFGFRNKFSVAGIASETEVNNGGLASAPPREVWSTAVPSNGYWQRGSIVRNIAPSDPGILGWVCVAAGTPGTWALLGGALSDPNADRIRFWDDSAGVETWLSLGAGLAISGTTLALANDVAALEALSGTGILARTASETYAQRTITGTSSEISVSNGDGVSGDPVLSLPSTVDLSAKTLPGIWRVIAASSVPVVRNSVNGAGDAVEAIAATVSIPANAMGANGRVRWKASWTVTNSGNTKTMRQKFGGTGGTRYREDSLTTSASLYQEGEFSNRNAANSQVGRAAFNAGRQGFDASTGSLPTSAQDTTAAVDLVFTTLWGGAASAESITLESYSVEVLYKA